MDWFSAGRPWETVILTLKYTLPCEFLPSFLCGRHFLSLPTSPTVNPVNRASRWCRASDLVRSRPHSRARGEAPVAPVAPGSRGCTETPAVCRLMWSLGSWRLLETDGDYSARNSQPQAPRSLDGAIVSRSRDPNLGFGMNLAVLNLRS